MSIGINDIADKLAEEHDLSKAAARKIVEGVIEGIKGAILAGDEVRLHGLGILKVKATSARQGRNPKTGETIQIAASRKVTFAAAKPLKDGLAA